MLSGFIGWTWVWALAEARRSDLPRGLVLGLSLGRREMFFLMACPCLSTLVGGVTALLLAPFTGSFSDSSGGWEAVRVPVFVGPGCVFCYCGCGLLWRLATVLTRKVEIHAVCV